MCGSDSYAAVQLKVQERDCASGVLSLHMDTPLELHSAALRQRSQAALVPLLAIDAAVPCGIAH